MSEFRTGYRNADQLCKDFGIQSVKNLLAEKQRYADRHGWSSDETFNYWSGYREFIDDYIYKRRIVNSLVEL